MATDNELLTSDGKATIVYKDGKATVTITDENNRVALVETLEDDKCEDCWLEFDFNGTHYRANVFDQPDDYGVGCWVYPNGDISDEIPLNTEVYEGDTLIRTN